VRERLSEPLTEVHIVGGHNPDLPYDFYIDLIRGIRELRPELHVKAFTASEYDFFAKRFKIPLDQVFRDLIDSGLGSLPGGGAEVLVERVRQELYRKKIPAERWLDVVRKAHGFGLRSNATMLYGHIETYAERVEHLRLLREQQDKSGGFLAFIPLEYQVSEEKLVQRHASAVEDLKTIAVSRLMLDNFPHIKAYWIMIQEDTAGIALGFGADDVDGTISKERIAHAADARSPVGVTRQRLVRVIHDAGRVPVERDALYNEVHVYSEAEVLKIAADDYEPIQRSRVSPRAGAPLEQNAEETA